MTEEQIILVNEQDDVTEFIGKMEAHEKGLLHRAFSLFIFNSEGKLLLQKRAEKKYHSGGLWTNTCCSHPIRGEDISVTIHRRLKEEMNLESELEFRFKFIYRADVGNGLIEHELDHVYFGVTDQLPELNPEEASDWKYVSKQELKADIDLHPAGYTEWLKICFEELDKRWR